ncbi:MAG: N-acetyl-alpha-D-glucosaminyl L-malate synthase BshA [Sumerlaeia bacterium]
MKIGIVCAPTYGGSGVVATEVGRFLARRGHEVHFISSEVPFRLLHDPEANVRFHEVQTLEYPVLNGNLYGIALASKIIQVAQETGLEIIHAHYAIPHTISAFLAREAANGGLARPLKVVTTLHGTDITLVGQAASFFPVARYAINASDAVTSVSQWLKDETVRVFDIKRPIEIIPNFVDVAKFRRGLTPCKRSVFAPNGEKIALHISNFRPVKRIEDVVRIFARIRQEVPTVLVMVGDGPDRDRAAHLACRLGISHDVHFLGKQDAIEIFMSCADLFLFPSEYESFGLAALEAMACEIPVVASASGGLNEVIRHGETGFLAPVGDVDAMAALGVRVLRDEALAHRIGQAARQEVHDLYLQDIIIPQYERLYERVLAGSYMVAPKSESRETTYQFADGI